MADLTINQSPVSISLVCETCGEEICNDYEEFCKEHGSLCDWGYDEITCPECGGSNTVDHLSFD